MDEFDDLKMSDSDDDEGAGERVRMIMEEIYKNQDKIKSEKDIEEMAERCTSMMTQMRNEAYIKKKEKKGQRSSGAGDKASPPPSRVKESPRKDSTKAAGSTLFPPPAKSAMKSPMEYNKKKSQKPNFSEMYKEKMDKLRVPGKTDLKGSQTKTDSTKVSENSAQPKMWSLNSTYSTTLSESHFRDAIDTMKESGMSVKGKEDDSSVDRIIKTIQGEESSDESESSYDFTKDSDDSVTIDEERLFAEKLLKELKEKNDKPMRPINISELRKPYMTWLDREKRALKIGGYTKKDGANKKKKKKDLYDNKEIEIYSSESSDDSIDTSEVESDPNDPFSKTPEGKEIMKKMKKIKVKSDERRTRIEEYDVKKRTELLQTKFRPSMEGVDIRSISNTPVDFHALAAAQAESRNSKGWIGPVTDVESLWFRDICKESERARKSES